MQDPGVLHVTRIYLASNRHSGTLPACQPLDTACETDVTFEKVPLYTRLLRSRITGALRTLPIWPASLSVHLYTVGLCGIVVTLLGVRQDAG